MKLQSLPNPKLACGNSWSEKAIEKAREQILVDSAESGKQHDTRNGKNDANDF
jgi:hypothetical protein